MPYTKKHPGKTLKSRRKNPVALRRVSGRQKDTHLQAIRLQNTH